MNLNSSFDSTQPSADAKGRHRTAPGRHRLPREIEIEQRSPLLHGKSGYVGRVGALAVAFGVGAGMLVMPGVAQADTSGSGGSAGSSDTAGRGSSNSTSSPSTGHRGQHSTEAPSSDTATDPAPGRGSNESAPEVDVPDAPAETPAPRGGGASPVVEAPRGRGARGRGAQERSPEEQLRSHGNPEP